MDLNLEKWMFCYVFILIVHWTDSQCTFPLSWDSLWYDSTITGDLTIDRSQLTVTGWTRVMSANTVTSWTCVLEDTSNNYLVFRSTNQFALDFGVMYYAYLCIHWTRVTDNSFYYYVRADRQNTAANERTYVIPSSQPQPSTASTVCSPTSGPTTEEFNMMVKQGEINNVKQQCPPPFLGTFTYTYNDGSSHCGSNSNWDVCTTQTTMTFDYTACSTKVAFTSEGVVHCVASISSGSTYYTYTINPGTVDNSNYYRFACFVVEVSGSNVVSSVSPKSCQVGQTATVIPTNGATATLTGTACPSGQTTTMTTTTMTTAATTPSSRVDAGFVAGLTIGVFIFIYSCTILIAIVLKECVFNQNGENKPGKLKPNQPKTDGNEYQRQTQKSQSLENDHYEKSSRNHKIHALPPIK